MVGEGGTALRDLTSVFLCNPWDTAAPCSAFFPGSRGACPACPHPAGTRLLMRIPGAGT